jgi:hypothetical protein
MELAYFKDYGYTPIGEIGKGGYGTVFGYSFWQIEIICNKA